MGFRWSEVQILSPRPVNLKLKSNPESNVSECYVNYKIPFGNKFGNKLPPPAVTEFLHQLILFQSENSCTDSYLAKLLGISRAYFSRLKRGERPLTALIETRIHQLFTGEILLFFPPFSAINSMGKKTVTPNRRARMEKVIDNFLTAKQVEGKTEATIRFYRENLGRILWWWRTQHYPEDIAGITADHIRALLKYVQTEPNRWGGNSNSSCHKASMSCVDAYWRTWQALFAWLVKEEVVEVTRNPMLKIPRPKLPEKVVQDIPRELFLKAMGTFDPATFSGCRNRAMLLTMQDSGARLQELQTMNIDDLHLAEGYALVWGKGEKQRAVGVAEEARRAIESYLEIHPSKVGALWVTEKGERLSRSGIQSIMKRLKFLGGGVRWSAHTLRVTFAVNFVRGGGDLFSLQTLGGWVDLEMPRRYTRALTVDDALRVHRLASPGNRFIANF